MSLKQQIDDDLKQALLANDRIKVDTLRSVKSVILNEEIARGKRGDGLPDSDIIACLKKEAKKRREAADLYQKAEANDRADKELAEKAIIDNYLPAAMSDSEIVKIVDQTIKQQGGDKGMGPIINKVRAETMGRADGAAIARIVKEKLGQG